MWLLQKCKLFQIYCAGNFNNKITFFKIYFNGIGYNRSVEIFYGNVKLELIFMILVKLTLILIISIFKYQWRLVESQILPLYGKTWVSKNPLFHIFYANLKSTNSVIIETVLPQSMFYLKNKKTWFVWSTIRNNLYTNQPAFTCSKLTIKPLEQGVKYVQI